MKDDDLARLRSLLADPHPGLAAWNEALVSAMKACGFVPAPACGPILVEAEAARAYIHAIRVHGGPSPYASAQVAWIRRAACDKALAAWQSARAALGLAPVSQP